jgi:hypothetical protein
VNDWEAALKVELDLPETGVCSLNIDGVSDGGACCGTETSSKAAVDSSCGSSSCGVSTELVVKQASLCCG